MRSSSRPGGSPRRGEAASVAAVPPTSLRRGALLTTIGIVAAAIAFSVTTLATSTDLWQHLTVGRAIWNERTIPRVHLWSYPTYGMPEVLPAWGFRALLWPFYAAGGDFGLQAWRWLTTLAAFGIAWLTARRMGARGLAPLFVVAFAALVYRGRSEVRPETLVALLLALQIAALERRRQSGGAGLALIGIAWAWANVHISYFIGLALLAIHAVVEILVRRPSDGTAPMRSNLLARLDRAPILVVACAALAISFVNPFGWRALWQPFEYFFLWRNEPVYQLIPELWSFSESWRHHLRSGLPLLMAGWVILVLWRPRGRRFDVVEALTCLMFVGLTLLNRRFYGFLAVACVPYVARDLATWLARWRLPAALHRPAARAAMVSAASVLIMLPEWLGSPLRFGIGWEAGHYPKAACDFMAAHDLRGTVFNPNYYGGYLLWRFWPDSTRLPFMDVHQSGTRAERDLYTFASVRPEAWDALVERWNFNLVMVDGHEEWIAGDHLLEYLDADPRFALVFRDDVAALYLRRDGRDSVRVDALGFRVMPASVAAFGSLWPRLSADSSLRARLRTELEQSAASSPLDAHAHSHLANLAFLERDAGRARAHLVAALEADPRFFTVHRRLGYLLMDEGRYREAIAAFQRECALNPNRLDEHQRMGEAWEKLGERDRARAEYRRELRLHPGNARAQQALDRLGR